VENLVVPSREKRRGTAGRAPGGVPKCLLRLKNASSRRSGRLPAQERGASIDIRAREARLASTRARIGHGTIGQGLAETRQDQMT
jgi:hypothetical protein